MSGVTLTLTGHEAHVVWVALWEFAAERGNTARFLTGDDAPDVVAQRETELAQQRLADLVRDRLAAAPSVQV